MWLEPNIQSLVGLTSKPTLLSLWMNIFLLESNDLWLWKTFVSSFASRLKENIYIHFYPSPIVPLFSYWTSNISSPDRGLDEAFIGPIHPKAEWWTGCNPTHFGPLAITLVGAQVINCSMGKRILESQSHCGPAR